MRSRLFSTGLKQLLQFHKIGLKSKKSICDLADEWDRLFNPQCGPHRSDLMVDHLQQKHDINPSILRRNPHNAPPISGELNRMFNGSATNAPQIGRESPGQFYLTNGLGRPNPGSPTVDVTFSSAHNHKPWNYNSKRPRKESRILDNLFKLSPNQGWKSWVLAISALNFHAVSIST